MRLRICATTMEAAFDSDVLSKRERVERTLSLRPVDRVAIHDQVSFNPGLIRLYTGKRFDGFGYTLEDICHVIRRTLDACFPPAPPRGRARVTDADGFVVQHDNWTSWTVGRPFSDVRGAREYLLRKTKEILAAPFQADEVRDSFRERMETLRSLVGETVVIDTSSTVGLCACWSRVGLELFCYLYDDHPEVISDFLDASVERQVDRALAMADPGLSPVILIADDFATKHGPIFSPEFLRREHFPRLQRLTEAWHTRGLKVIYHSDGNWRSVIPDLIDCGVDGFYCLEPSIGMDVVELKRTWPNHVWAGGVDGVDLMERGNPEQVAIEVRRQIIETGALETGGLFIGTSSEVNPPIRPANFEAMIDAVGQLQNTRFRSR